MIFSQFLDDEFTDSTLKIYALIDDNDDNDGGDGGDGGTFEDDDTIEDGDTAQTDSGPSEEGGPPKMAGGCSCDSTPLGESVSAGMWLLLVGAFLLSSRSSIRNYRPGN